MAEQRTPAAEQHLRMVPMISGPTLVSEEEEKNGRKGEAAEIIGTYS